MNKTVKSNLRGNKNIQVVIGVNVDSDCLALNLSFIALLPEVDGFKAQDSLVATFSANYHSSYEENECMNLKETSISSDMPHQHQRLLAKSMVKAIDVMESVSMFNVGDYHFVHLLQSYTETQNETALMNGVYKALSCLNIEE